METDVSQQQNRGVSIRNVHFSSPPVASTSTSFQFIVHSLGCSHIPVPLNLSGVARRLRKAVHV